MKSQYAYQKSRSTEAALQDLFQKEFVLRFFLDKDGTFEYAFFSSMDAASGEHRVGLTLRKWIDAMIHFRRVLVEIRRYSVKMLVN
jgi:hypothetical protein